MAFKKGQSGNPLGRPINKKNKIPSNKQLRDTLKKGCPEAINATMAYLREYRCDANIAKKKASEILNEMLLMPDSPERDKLATKLRYALSDKDIAFDKTLKASFKIMDSTYSMVVAEDKLEITKKSSPKSPEEEDDEEEDIPSAVIQLTSVKT